MDVNGKICDPFLGFLTVDKTPSNPYFSIFIIKTFRVYAIVYRQHESILGEL